MAFLTDQERKRIEDAVEQAEKKTAGEFVTVIARAADDYLYIPTLAAAGLVLILSGVAVLFLPDSVGLFAFYAGQVIAFVALAILARWTPLKMALVPKPVKHQRASRLAHELFFDLGLSSTRERTGVMLFVSAAEHYVEIIADRGIQQHIDNAAWEGIVADFVAKVRTGAVTDGFVAAIEACTDIMARSHPGTPDSINELPNRLVEL